jgi:hypothetical protein
MPRPLYMGSRDIMIGKLHKISKAILDPSN